MSRFLITFVSDNIDNVFIMYSFLNHITVLKKKKLLYKENISILN